MLKNKVLRRISEPKRKRLEAGEHCIMRILRSFTTVRVTKYY
jgi:hypothetical protein